MLASPSVSWRPVGAGTVPGTSGWLFQMSTGCLRIPPPVPRPCHDVPESGVAAIHVWPTLDWPRLGVLIGASQIARRRRSASGYKQQFATSGPMAVSRWLAGGTFSLPADVGTPSAGHRRPTIGLPPAGHRWLATVVPTMSAIFKNIRNENTCSSTFTRGTYILVIA